MFKLVKSIYRTVDKSAEAVAEVAEAVAEGTTKLKFSAKAMNEESQLCYEEKIQDIKIKREQLNDPITQLLKIAEIINATSLYDKLPIKQKEALLYRTATKAGYNPEETKFIIENKLLGSHV